MDSRVLAIRDDILVGRGTCTSIDECYTDKEIEELLDEMSLVGDINAVRWAREHEGLWLEAGLNQRWGSDDDPQLKMWNDWIDKLNNNPI